MDMEGIRPQARGRLEPPEAGRGGKDPPLAPLEGARPWDTSTSDFWSPELGEGECLWFSVTQSGVVFTAAPGN